MKKTTPAKSELTETRIYEQDSIAYLTLTQGRTRPGTGISSWNDLEPHLNIFQQLELVSLNGVILALNAANYIRDAVTTHKSWWGLTKFMALSSGNYRQRRIEQLKWLVGEFILIALMGLVIGYIIGRFGF